MTSKYTLSTALLIGALFGITACSNGTEVASTMTNEQVRAQQLGESTQPVWFSGEGAGVLPNYDERVVVHFYNRIRFAPQNWPFVNDMGQALLIPAYPAGIYQPFMAETGRWQAQHGIDTGCNCDEATVGYDPEDPNTSEQEKFVGATCCEVGVVDGVAKCVSPLVACTDARATLRTQRWALLNQGAGSIDTEFAQNVPMALPSAISIIQGFITLSPDGTAAQLGGLAGDATNRKVNALGISLSEGKITPPECIEGKENVCGDGGTCKDNTSGSETCDKTTNPNCLGLCAGNMEGNPCQLPEQIGTPDECKPENFPKVAQIAFLTGSTIEPAPSLGDGIHYQIFDDTAFDKTAMGNIAFGVNYYERTGDPVGTPNEIKLVLNGTCHDLEALPNKPTLADNSPAKFAGITYKTEQPATAGCIPYVFVAKDAAGFEYTYPEYGALQAQVNAEGAVVRNDDTCPIWVKDRVDLTCAADADECTNGEKRACYTGRAGTQDNGICKVGEETCSNGRWSGTCDGEVTPEPTDTCGDNKDNDCNGGTDETCEDGEKPKDMGNNTPDMNSVDMGSTQDMGGIVITPPKDDDKEDDGCGCRTVEGAPKSPSLPILILSSLAALVFWRRRA